MGDGSNFVLLLAIVGTFHDPNSCSNRLVTVTDDFEEDGGDTKGQSYDLVRLLRIQMSI